MAEWASVELMMMTTTVPGVSGVMIVAVGLKMLELF